ncbi:hypothetical protein KFL_002620010 [Klebsormidium nitens]|uniref:Uncharacterized protein n=1 Tax=Klebsormidium nitens TaxID=105231 RepID=A0A1Y1I4R2_KLENI|nr:hypothetical protein KFL_002620010 [Klebsormidium nitens]|eukprot:GAQ85934.1 hypothetical protein KFL_002620010 [Klebsormidium nitens]
MASMSSVRTARLLPASDFASSSAAPQNSGTSAVLPKWRSQAVAAPPERPVLERAPLQNGRSPLQEQSFQQIRHRILPLRLEPETSGRSWTREEATEQNLIYRMMFAEEPRWLKDGAGQRKETHWTRHSPMRSQRLMANYTADPELKTVCASYGGLTKTIKLHQGCSDEMVEQLLREAFDLCPERVICLRDRITGAVTAAKTQMAEGDYEIITDEDQDVAGHLPVKSLHRQITRTASKAAVKDALKHCGLAHILPELKHMSGAKLLSMPLDALQTMYSLSGWRLRAVRSLYLALHPPARIRVEDPASGEGSATLTVASAKEFSELLGAQNCVALRACDTRGVGHLAVRFEDLRDGHAYSPVRVNSNLFGCIEAAL